MGYTVLVLDPDDILGRASKAFRDIGHRVRTTVGIGVGSVSLALESTAVAPGGEVRGRVTLALPEPTEAKRLVLAVRATQQVAKIGGKDQPLVRTDTLVVWKHHLELAGERTYADGETFEGAITIPADVLDRAPELPDGVLGQAVRAVQAVSSASRMPLQWRAMALLDIPWKRNIKKLIDLSVSRPGPEI